ENQVAVVANVKISVAAAGNFAVFINQKAFAQCSQILVNKGEHGTVFQNIADCLKIIVINIHIIQSIADFMVLSGDIAFKIDGSDDGAAAVNHFSFFINAADIFVGQAESMTIFKQ